MAHSKNTPRTEDAVMRAAHANKARERDREEQERQEAAGKGRLIDPAAGEPVDGMKLDLNVNRPQPQPRDFALDAPSQIKNNLDQIAQPTGDGGIAGGKIPPVGETGSEKAPGVPKTVLVELLKGYVPKGEYLVDRAAPAAVAGTGSAFKLHPGTTVRVSPEEAEDMINAGVANRGVETI